MTEVLGGGSAEQEFTIQAPFDSIESEVDNLQHVFQELK